jgi:hypothetical protein
VPNGLVKVFDGTTQIGTLTAGASGAWSFTTSTLADGTHSFTALDLDAAGTSSLASSALNVTVNSVTPKPIIANFIDNSNGTVTLSGTSAANSALSIYDGTNTTPLATVTTAANGTWSFTTGILSSGNHSFTVKAVDTAGNVWSSTGGIHYSGAFSDTPTIVSGSVGGITEHTQRTQGFNDLGPAHLLLHNGQQLASWEMNDTSNIGGGDIGTLGSGSAIAGFTDLLLQNNQLLATSLLYGTTAVSGGLVGPFAQVGIYRNGPGL